MFASQEADQCLEWQQGEIKHRSSWKGWLFHTYCSTPLSTAEVSQSVKMRASLHVVTLNFEVLHESHPSAISFSIFHVILLFFPFFLLFSYLCSFFTSFSLSVNDTE
jgi:hypothetical protein